MKFLPLIWSSLARKKVRTVFTLLSVFIAFLLFGYLSAIKAAFQGGVDIAGVDRLIMVHKMSLINPLPFAYKRRIETTEGISAVTQASWFGGYYQEQRNFFAQFPVDPQGYLDMYPEISVSEEQKQAWFADRGGALIGRGIANRFGWQPGDRIPLISPIWRNKDGGNTWEFTISGIFDAGVEGFDTSNMIFHHEYFDEGRAWGDGLVGWYIIRVDDPERLQDKAKELDAMFANSPRETKTTSEKEFLQGFVDQVGDIGAIFTAIISVVLFTLFLITGNTMAQSVRERTAELAVMKVVGFSRRRLLSMVLSESMLVAVLGGGAGLGTAWLIVTTGGDPTNGFLPAFYIQTKDLVMGALLVIGVGAVSGALPAMQAYRLENIVALRKVA
ncbi:MAG: ABC transporter permease [Gammaproteobacteria bacterium]|nr:MAG: ABC transporter permease [Gammaproteobacteria bacterium]